MSDLRFQNKKVIVTGGAGFIGSHLVDKLVEEGADVIVFDNMSSGYKQNLNPKAKFIWLDFTVKGNVDYYFDEIKPDYVFHVGAWGRMPMCLEDPVGAYQNNLIGTVNILEASRRNNVKKVVLSSSCIVYCQPTPYWSTKKGLEEVAFVYRKMYNLQTICLRYGNVYGERQKVGMDSAMFAMLKDSFNKDGKVKIFGDGESTRDWVYVGDVVEANILACLTQNTLESDLGVDVCTGRSLSLNYIIKEVLKIPFEHVEERKGDERHIKLDPESAKTGMGFEAKIKFEDKILEVWKSL